MSGRNLIGLRLGEIEDDSRNRRVAEKESGAHGLERAAIDFEGAQVGGGKRAGKIDDDAIGAGDGLGIGRYGSSGGLDLDFHGIAICTNYDALDASGIRRGVLRGFLREDRRRQRGRDGQQGSDIGKAWH